LNYGKTWPNEGWWILNSQHKELIFLRKEGTPRQGEKQLRGKLYIKELTVHRNGKKSNS
jgi:hypothetical protein